MNDNADTMNNTKKKSANERWKCTIGECVRRCPKCNREIVYTTYQGFAQGNQRNSVCLSCARIGQNNPQYGKPGNRLGLRFSNETRKKMSQYRQMHQFGSDNPFYGRKHNEQTLRKMREHRLNGVSPAFNPLACQKIDEYGKQHGYTFQHALNGGEVKVIGYSLDGYDKEKNVVIEYYERHHNKPIQQKKDEVRKQRIVKHLGCKFIELREGERL